MAEGASLFRPTIVTYPCMPNVGFWETQKPHERLPRAQSRDLKVIRFQRQCFFHHIGLAACPHIAR